MVQCHHCSKGAVHPRQGVAQGYVGPDRRPVDVAVEVTETAVRFTDRGIARVSGLGARLQAQRRE